MSRMIKTKTISSKVTEEEYELFKILAVKILFKGIPNSPNVSKLIRKALYHYIYSVGYDRATIEDFMINRDPHVLKSLLSSRQILYNYRNYCASHHQEKTKSKIENDNIISDNPDFSNTTKEKTGSYESYRSYRNCYYSTEGFDLESDYVKHVINKHQGKPCYPGKADIEHYRLTPQGKDWEGNK